MSSQRQSDMSRKRLWAIRALQVSPLIVLLLMAAVWVAIPGPQRASALLTNIAYLMEPDSMPRRDPLEAALRRALEERNAVVLPDGTKTYQGAMDGNGNEELVKLLPEVVKTVKEGRAVVVNRSGMTVKTMKSDDPALRGTADYEQRTGASVVALVADRARPVRVVYASIVNPILLSPEQLAEIESSGTAEALRRSLRGSAPVDYEGIGSGVGGPLGPGVGEQHGTVAIGGRIYEVYLLYPERKSASATLPDVTNIKSAKQQRLKRALDRIARQTGGVAVLAGPVDAPPQLLRAPSSLSENDAVRLGEGVLEQHLSPFGTSDMSARPLPASLAGVAPRSAAWSVMAVRSGSPDPSQPWSIPAVILIALTPRHPAIPLLDAELADDPWIRVQARLAAYLPEVAGVLAALFLASLIASPAAFIYERRRTTEQELQRERERLREQARRRVLERLQELSRRIDRVAAASQRTHEEIRLVSDDIDATVDELRVLFESGYRAGESDD